MEWSKLLSTRKLATEEPEPPDFEQYPISAFERDYNKIVSSAAFRRLQDKTQVFPLDKSDFVRTRLTHSIEVSTIARQLGIMISKNTTPYKKEEIGERESEGICSVLQCAGLLHDLGNPPFGHFGEATIGEWFRENLDEISYKGKPLRQQLKPQMAADLEHFEGNAQALRILAKGKYNSEMNLSAAVISTLVKYPTESLKVDKASPDVRRHKLGCYYGDRDSFLRISQIVGTRGENGEIFRHPLTYMLEAADDIAYATADLEDAFAKGLFTLNDFIAFFKDSFDWERSQQHNKPEYYSRQLIYDLKGRRGKEPTPVQDSRAFREWIVYVRRWLMYIAVYRFSRSYDEIMKGQYQQDLFYGTNHSESIKILKNAMGQFVYDSPGILKLELSSQTILSFLLDKFVHAALYFDYQQEGWKPSKADKKFMSLFPDNYKQDYLDARTGDEQMDLYLRLLMVTDYISGMTDSYARTLYRELSGIE